MQTDPKQTDPNSDEQASARRWHLSFSMRAFLFVFVILAVGFGYLRYQLNQPLPPAVFWNEDTGQNVKWSVKLATQCSCNPTLGDGKIFIGCNNGAGLNPRYPASIDRGVMACFSQSDGKLLWHYSVAKIESGRSQDWPMQGIVSQANFDAGKIWFVDSRCQVVCLDADGFLDGTNDGPWTDEEHTKTLDPDIIWRVDMRQQFGVSPHNLSHCNVAVDEANVYVCTSHGVDPSHSGVSDPKVPSFVALNRQTGQVVWTDNRATAGIMHACWGSPKLATIEGRRQVIFAGGDGWLYGFHPDGDGNGKPNLYWKFDCNLKKEAYTVTHAIAPVSPNRMMVLSTPTVCDDKIIVTMGDDPELGCGSSFIWCIKPGLREGDISPTLVTPGNDHQPPSFDNQYQHCIEANGDQERENPNSGLHWKHLSRRSLCTPAVHNDSVFSADLDGYVTCLDLETGKLNWKFDSLSTNFGALSIFDELLYVGTEDGEILVFDASPSPQKKPLACNFGTNYHSIYSRTGFQNGVIIAPNRCRLIAIENEEAKNRIQRWLSK